MDNSEHFSNVIEVTTERGRKRNRRKETWTREISKRERYTSKSLPRKPQCGHDTNTYKCTTLAMQDIRRFHQAFYATSRKASQDSFILKYTSQMSPKRTSRSKVANSSRKTSSNKYYVKTLHGPVQVCATTFLSILGISRYRVQNLCRKHLSTGYSPKENRGGERSNKIYEAKRNAVCEFIKKLQPVEEHYTKNKTKCQYLECGLSMKKLWRIYNGSNDSEFKVKYSLFIHIFQYNFNISFKTPRTDACSTCLQLTNQMKAATTGSEEKVDLMVKLRVHKLKASAFYSQIKERRTERTVVFTYDCQKNLVLPRVPDQAAYYSRQMFMYNFTMCRGHSKAPQNKDTVTMYAWLENERLKGSNEIASAIIDTLRTADLSDGDIECIQLCSDGCPGQNKNSIVIGVVMKWFSEECPQTIKQVRFLFPIVGHSFLPPDRVFGRIEKVIRSRETVITPDEYIDIFKSFGTVKRLGKEVPVFDWKTSVQNVLKPTSQWHFRLSMCKRIILTKNKNGAVRVRGEINYETDCSTVSSIIRRGMAMANIHPEPLLLTVPVKKAKLKDVNNLLSKHFGENWRDLEDLEYYRNVIDALEEDEHRDANAIEECANVDEADDPMV